MDEFDILNKPHIGEKSNTEIELELIATRNSLVVLQKTVLELKYHLSPDGGYSICKTNGEKMNVADIIEIGNVFEKIDKLLPSLV
jgi:hypothetical protein